MVEKMGLEECPSRRSSTASLQSRSSGAQCNGFLALSQKQGVNTQKFVVMGSSVAVVRHLTLSALFKGLSLLETKVGI